MSNKEVGEIRTIPEHDYKSDYYVIRKPALVTFLAQDHPIGTKQDAKLKGMVTNKESSLVNREVDIDMKLLDEFFREQCSIKPTIEFLVNHKYDEICEYMNTIDGAKYDAFFLFFLSYLSIKERNKKGELPGLKVECYDTAVPIEEFMGMVKGRRDMALKPKIFVFQADDRDLLKPNIIKKAAGFLEDVELERFTIPTDADQLMLLSTLPQRLQSLKQAMNVVIPTASDRGGIVGQPSDEAEKVAVKPENSLLIRALVEVLKANRDADVLCCTPLINRKVEQMTASLDLEREYGKDYAKKLLLPVVTSTLTKDLNFYQKRDFPFGL